jgi:hypothetical protein
MLLDVLSDQIIDDGTDEVGNDSFYVWYYINRFTNYTVDTMMVFISTEIVQYLLIGNSIYLAKYAIHLLTRMCTQLRRV